MIIYTSKTDMELAVLLQTGDEGVFKVIYKRYWDKLLVVAGKRLGNIDEAEDVVQEIFLNLWKRREKFHLKVNFDHYFAVAVKFEVINRLAKRSREHQRNETFAQDNPKYHELKSTTFDLETLERQLENTICSLPKKCQLIFRMSRETDFTNKKIAQQLDISEKAVEKHITNALKVIKSRFGPLFFLALALLPVLRH